MSLDLEPFTVLVGANASGKTTILEALHRVCGLRFTDHTILVTGDMPFENSAYLSPDSVLSYGKADLISFNLVCNGHNLNIGFKKDVDWILTSREFDEFDVFVRANYDFSYTFVEGLFISKLPAFDLLKDSCKSLPVRLLIQANFSSLSKPSHSPLKIPFLERDGSGLGTVCQYLQQELPDAFSRVQEHLAAVIKGLKRFRIRRADATAKNFVNLEPDPNWTGIAEELIFDFGDAVGVSAKYVSEGTLLVLCILVAAARFEGEALILIDDLERGLHPKAVRDLIGALRKLQEINPKLQIVATSHSPYILSELKPQEVRVVARDPSMGTVVGRLTDHPDFAKWSEVMDVGEFWSHVGEDWLLKQKEYA
jgi:hypothetical protein